jgi:hypothetical protein
VAARLLEALEPRLLFSGYYVNSAAGSGGNGSASSPWNDLASISSYGGFHSGDVVNLTGTFNNQVLILGSADAGITITTSSTSPASIVEPPSFNQTAAIQVSGSSITISGLQLTGPGSTASSDSYYAIWLDNTTAAQMTGETLRNITETGFVFAGLEIYGNSNGFTNTTVSNCSFSNNQVSGIVAESTSSGYAHANLNISNCVTSNNAGHAIYYDAHHSGADQDSYNGGIMISSTNGALVDHCKAFNNCYNSADAVGIWAFNATGVIFQYSESADNKTTTASADGDGFDFDHGVSNSIMQYDYSHGNDGPGYFVCTFGGVVTDTADTIRYCISDDDAQLGGAGILVYGYSQMLIPHPVLGLNVYNNTVLAGAANSSCVAINGLTPTAAGFVTANFLNNIFYSSNGGTLVDCSYYTPSNSNIIFEGNDYWSNGAAGNFLVKWGAGVYSSFASPVSWVASTAQELLLGTLVGTNSDPQLVNESASDLPAGNISNLQLTTSSPLRGAGPDLTSYPFGGIPPYTNYSPYNLAGPAWNGLGGRDYFGNAVARGGSHDIGADQASSLVLTGSPAGDNFYLKEDPVQPNTLNVNGTTYSLTGIDSVVVNGSTGNENFTFDFQNGPLTNGTGLLDRFGVTFHGGSAVNSVTTLDSGSGAASGTPVFFTPGSSGSNSATCSSGIIVVPSGPVQSTAVFTSIRIDAGTEVYFAGPARDRSNKTLVVISSGLTMAGTTGNWTGTLDLGGNDLDYKHGNLAMISNQIHQGWNEQWQVAGGIISSAAAADTTHLTALGSLLNTNTSTVPASAYYNTFDSVTVAATDVLVKYTYIGDANLDGVVSSVDYAMIDNGWLLKLTGWSNGDFNGDGAVNASDYTLIDNAFNTQGASLAAEIARPAKQIASARQVQPVWPNPHGSSRHTLRKRVRVSLIG